MTPTLAATLSPKDLHHDSTVAFVTRRLLCNYVSSHKDIRLHDFIRQPNTSLVHGHLIVRRLPPYLEGSSAPGHGQAREVSVLEPHTQRPDGCLVAPVREGSDAALRRRGASKGS